MVIFDNSLDKNHIFIRNLKNDSLNTKMTTQKIQQLKDSIANNHSNDLKFKIEEVLSICESEIEKLMLLQLYNYFQNYGINRNPTLTYFINLEFIEDEILLGDPSVSENENLNLKKIIKRLNYRFEEYGYYKFIGFRVEINGSEPKSVNSIEIASVNSTIENPIRSISREFEIYPQSEVIINGTNIRVDIAIIINRKDYCSGEIIESRKIAIECDGYDYHSSPTQKRDDDIRTRKLKKGGWKEVLRYSGTEIYNINGINRMNYLFDEIIEILMI